MPASSGASGANMTSRVTARLLQTVGMMIARRRHDLVGGDAASRIRF